MDMESRTCEKILKAGIDSKMRSRVVFADEKLKKAFDDLQNSETEDKNLYDWLNRAFMSYTNKAPNEVR